MISLDVIEKIGQGLNRPECVLAHQSGLLFCSDWTGAGGVSIVSPNGESQKLLSNEKKFIVRPNGIAVENSGSFLVAHLGEQEGGIYRLHPNGSLEDVLTTIDGATLPPSNYIHIDTQGRFWITVSTRKVPRAAAYRSDVADGFVILLDKRGARIVADGLGYTNECLVHPDGKRLFVNETFARRLISFDISDDGSLSNRKTVCEFGEGTFPDGMTFDTDGGIWITSIISNRVIRVLEDGSQQVIIEDVDTDHLKTVETAFEQQALDRPHLDHAYSKKLKNISSLAFGGADLKTAYLGCLLGDHIAYFTLPDSSSDINYKDIKGIRGVAPNHWGASLGELMATLNVQV